MTERVPATILVDRKTTLTFGYLNYRGEESQRIVEVMSVWYGSTEFHLDPQWFLKARDLRKDEVRDFAMADIRDPAEIKT